MALLIVNQEIGATAWLQIATCVTRDAHRKTVSGAAASEEEYVIAKQDGARAKLDALNLDLIDVKKFAPYFLINVSLSKQNVSP